MAKYLMDDDFNDEIRREKVVNFIDDNYDGAETYQRANEVILATDSKKMAKLGWRYKPGMPQIKENLIVDEFNNPIFFESEKVQGVDVDTGRMFFKTFDRHGREVYANLASNSLKTNLDLNKSKISLSNKAGEVIETSTKFLSQEHKLMIAGKQFDFSLLGKKPLTQDELISLVDKINKQISNEREKGNKFIQESNRPMSILSWVNLGNDNPFVQVDARTQELSVANMSEQALDEFVLTGYGLNRQQYTRQAKDKIRSAKDIVSLVTDYKKIAVQSNDGDSHLFKKINKRVATFLGISSTNVRFGVIAEAFSSYMLGLKVDNGKSMESIFAGRDVYTRQGSSGDKIVDKITSAFWELDKEVAAESKYFNKIRKRFGEEVGEINKDKDKAEGEKRELEKRGKIRPDSSPKNKERVQRRWDEFRQELLDGRGIRFEELKNIEEESKTSLKNNLEETINKYAEEVSTIKRESLDFKKIFNLFSDIDAKTYISESNYNAMNFIFTGTKFNNVIQSSTAMGFSKNQMVSLLSEAANYKLNNQSKNASVIRFLENFKQQASLISTNSIEKEDEKIFKESKKSLLSKIRNVDITNAKAITDYGRQIDTKVRNSITEIKEIQETLGLLTGQITDKENRLQEVKRQIAGYKTSEEAEKAGGLISERNKLVRELGISGMPGMQQKLKSRLNSLERDVKGFNQYKDLLKYISSLNPGNVQSKEQTVESFIKEKIINPRYKNNVQDLLDDIDIMITGLKSNNFDKTLNELTNDDERKKIIQSKTNRLFETFDVMSQDLEELKNNNINYFYKKLGLDTSMKKASKLSDVLGYTGYADIGNHGDRPEILQEDYNPDPMQDLHRFQIETDLQSEKTGGLRGRAKMSFASPRQNILAHVLGNIGPMSKEEMALLEEKKTFLREIIEDANKNNYAYRFEGSQILESLIGIDNENNLLVTRTRMTSASQIGVKLKYKDSSVIEKLLKGLEEVDTTGMSVAEIQEATKDSFKDLQNVTKLKTGELKLEEIYDTLSQDELRKLKDSQTLRIKNNTDALKLMNKNEYLDTVARNFIKERYETEGKLYPTLFENVGKELRTIISRSAAWSLYAFKENEKEFEQELATHVLSAFTDATYGTKDVLELDKNATKLINEDFEKRFLASYTKLFFENKDGSTNQGYVESLIKAIRNDLEQVHPEKFEGVMGNEKMASNIHQLIGANSEAGKLIMQHYPAYRKAMNYEVILDTIKSRISEVSIDAMSGGNEELEDGVFKGLIQIADTQQDVVNQVTKQESYKEILDLSNKYEKLVVSIDQINKGQFKGSLPKNLHKDFLNIIREMDDKRINQISGKNVNEKFEEIIKLISQGIDNKGIDDKSRVQISKLTAMNILYDSIREKVNSGPEATIVFNQFLKNVESNTDLKTLRQDLLEEVSNKGQVITFSGSDASEKLYRFIQEQGEDNVEVTDLKSGKELRIIQGTNKDIIAQEQASGNKSLVVNRKVRELSNKMYRSISDIYEEKIQEHLKTINNTTNTIKPDNRTIFSVGGKRLQYIENNVTGLGEYIDITHTPTQAINDRRIDYIRFKTVKDKKTKRTYEQAIIGFEGGARPKIMKQILDESGNYVWDSIGTLDSDDNIVLTSINKLKAGQVIHDERVRKRKINTPESTEHFIAMDEGELFRVKDKVLRYTGVVPAAIEKDGKRISGDPFEDVTQDPYKYGEGQEVKIRHIMAPSIQNKDRVALDSVKDSANPFRNPEGTVPLDISGKFFFDEQDRIPNTAKYLSSSGLNTLDSVQEFINGRKAFAFDLETTGTSESESIVRRGLFAPIEMYGRTVEFNQETGSILRSEDPVHMFLDIGNQKDMQSGRTVSKMLSDYQSADNQEFNIRRFIENRLGTEAYNEQGGIKSWQDLDTAQKAFVLADDEISFFRNIAKYSSSLQGTERDAIMAMGVRGIKTELGKDATRFGYNNEEINKYLQRVLGHASLGIERIKQIASEIPGATLHSNVKDFVNAYEKNTKDKIVIGQNVADADISWMNQWGAKNKKPGSMALIELMHMTSFVRPDMRYRSLNLGRKEFLGKAEELGAHLANVDTEDTINILEKQIGIMQEKQAKGEMATPEYLSKNHFLLKVDSSGSDYGEFGAYRLRQDAPMDEVLKYNDNLRQYELQLESFDPFDTSGKSPRIETVKAESLKELQYKIAGNYMSTTEQGIVPMMEAQVLDDVRRMVGEAKIKGYSMSKEMNVRNAVSDLKENPFQDGAVLNLQRKLIEMKRQGLQNVELPSGVLQGKDAEAYYDMLTASYRNAELLSSDSMMYMNEEKSDRYKRAFNEATKFFESEDAKRIQAFQEKVENLRGVGAIKSDEESRSLITQFNERIKQRAAQMEQPRVADKIKTAAMVDLGTINAEEFAGMKSKDITVNAFSKPYIHSSLWNVINRMSDALPKDMSGRTNHAISSLKSHMVSQGIEFNSNAKMSSDILDMVDAVQNHYLKNGSAEIDNPLYTYIKDANDNEMISIFDQVEKELLYDGSEIQTEAGVIKKPGPMQLVIGPESPMHNPDVYYPEMAISYENSANYRQYLKDNNMYVAGMDTSMNAGILSDAKINDKAIDMKMEQLKGLGVESVTPEIARESIIKEIDSLTPDSKMYQMTGGESLGDIVKLIKDAEDLVGGEREGKFRDLVNIAMTPGITGYEEAREFLGMNSENPLDAVVTSGKYTGMRFGDILTGDKKTDLNSLEGLLGVYGKQAHFISDNVPEAEKIKVNEYMYSFLSDIVGKYKNNQLGIPVTVDGIQNGLSEQDSLTLKGGLHPATDTEGMTYKNFQQFHDQGGGGYETADGVAQMNRATNRIKKEMESALNSIKKNPAGLLIGGSVLMGGMMLSQLTGVSGMRQEERPKHDDISKGSSSEPIKNSSAPYQGPPPSTSTYLTDNQGYNVNVNARNPNGISNNDIGNAFHRGMNGQQVPMNIHHQDDTSQVDSQWLSERFTELLNQNFVRG